METSKCICLCKKVHFFNKKFKKDRKLFKTMQNLEFSILILNVSKCHIICSS